MYEAVWEYEVDEESRPAFEAFYGASGEWVRLFRRSPAFEETVLFSDVARQGHYLTVDRWTSREAYDAFLGRFRRDYEALDERSAGLTLVERRLAER